MLSYLHIPLSLYKDIIQKAICRNKKTPVYGIYVILLYAGFPLSVYAQTSAASGGGGAILIQQDFQSPLDERWRVGAEYSSIEKHIEEDCGPKGVGDRCVRADFIAKNKEGGAGEGGNGTVSGKIPFDGNAAVEEATLEFDVFFENSWDFTASGKMHGLGPEQVVTGCKKVEDVGGWSARTVFNKETLRAYYYGQDQHTLKGNALGKICGHRVDDVEDTNGAAVTTIEHMFKKEVWHRVTLYVKLNSQGNADGIISVSIDGTTVSHREQVAFRDNDGDADLMTRFYFQVFMNPLTFPTAQGAETGDRGEFVEGYTAYVRFDNIKVTEGKAATVPGASQSPIPFDSCTCPSLQ